MPEPLGAFDQHMNEALNMTEGERMVWAAAYAHALRADTHIDGLERGAHACEAADGAIVILRFNGLGPGHAEMCELGRVGGV